METTTNSKKRAIIRTVPSQETIEGGGFTVLRPFPTRGLDHVDPFLLFDEAGPMDHKPDGEGGLPDHPHRGFETLTYVLAGEMDSHDSSGFRDIFYPGDVEWTTAGSGIIHGGDPRPSGGPSHVIQIWVNLPRSKKWIAPKSQRVAAESVPVITNSERGYAVKVLGGSAEGISGPLTTTWPILYLDYTLQPGGSAILSVPQQHNIIMYVLSGAALVGNERLTASQLGIFSDGTSIEFSNAANTVTRLLILGAEPIGEPVSRYGPFVMNERDEVFQAFDDFNAGKFGKPYNH